MVSQIRKVKVFLSSPGDVSAERNIAKEVCDEINLDLGGMHSFSVELIRWETHARPSIDERSQNVINREIGDDYDIYLGVFGTRFGSPTGHYESGTEEEFRLAHEKALKGKPIDFLFYFFSGNIEASRVDPKQLLKVQGFRESLEPLGILYWNFTNPLDFKILLYRHLSRAIRRTLEKHQDRSSPDATPSDSLQEWAFLPNYRSLLDSNPIANATTLMSTSTSETLKSAKSLQTINEQIGLLNTKILSATRIINLANSDQKYAIKKLPESVQDMHIAFESYIKVLHREIPALAKSYTEALGGAQRSLLVIIEAGELNSDLRTTLTASLNPLRDSILGAKESFVTLSQRLSPLPILGDRYEVNRLSVIALHADLDAFMTSAVALVEGILQLIKD